MRNFKFIIALITAFIGSGMVAELFAQAPPPPPPAIGAPIDTFVGILLILAAIFGTKYLIGKGK